MILRRNFGATTPEPIEAPARRVWQGIEADDPPTLRDDFTALLAMAETMLASRRKRFPALVAARELAQDAADAEIATFSAIAADWRWLAKGEGNPAPLSTIDARRAALDASIATIAQIAREQGGFRKALTDQAEAVIAMRWHLEPGRRTHALVELSRGLRADIARRPASPPIVNQEVRHGR